VVKDIPPTPEELVITEPGGQELERELNRLVSHSEDRPSKLVTLFIFGMSILQYFLVPGPWWWSLFAAFATFAVLSLLRVVFWKIWGGSWP
jgi:uncharacterized membrane protein YjjP (DUF1212 family)